MNLVLRPIITTKVVFFLIVMYENPRSVIGKPKKHDELSWFPLPFDTDYVTIKCILSCADKL